MSDVEFSRKWTQLYIFHKNTIPSLIKSYFLFVYQGQNVEKMFINYVYNKSQKGQTNKHRE